MNMLASRTVSQDQDFLGTLSAQQQGIVVIVSDNSATLEQLAPVCEFLDLRMEVVATGQDLSRVLSEQTPMAAIVDVDGQDQDGFHTMKLIARNNRGLPIMLLTGGDPALMGAADAVQDVWGLTAVTLSSDFPIAGQLVGFLFNAGRAAGCMRLVPV